LACATFIVYSNIFNNELLFDDDLLIHLNSYLRGWDTFGHLFTASTTEGAHIPGGFYRPMQNFLYFFIFQIQGETPFGYHLLNVGLHAANVCLGYRLALKLGLDPRAALIGMLIWAVHPLHTEAITYMSGTADPLYVFFGMLMLNRLFPQPTMKNVLWCIPLMALAMLSKETAIVMPALAVVCLFYVSPEKFSFKTYKVLWPLWVFAITYLAWRVTSTHFDGPARYAMSMHLPEFENLRLYNGDSVMRFYTFLATLPAYVQLLVWPVGLHMERAFFLYNVLAPEVLIGFVILLMFFAQLTWGQGKRGLTISWGFLWFAAAYFPNTGLFFSMNSLFLEHWMYLPTMGLFLSLAQEAVRLADRLKSYTVNCAGVAVCMVIVVALSGQTLYHNTAWRDAMTFYTNMFSYDVTSPRGHNNLAIAYMKAGNLPQAIEEYKTSVREGDTYAETHYNLALAYMSLPDQKANQPLAVAELQRALQMEPRFYRAYVALAAISDYNGDPTRAAMYREKAHDIVQNWTSGPPASAN
jgi:Tfp pilus assembly protein PilF